LLLLLLLLLLLRLLLLLLLHLSLQRLHTSPIGRQLLWHKWCFCKLMLVIWPRLLLLPLLGIPTWLWRLQLQQLLQPLLGGSTEAVVVAAAAVVVVKVKVRRRRRRG